MDYITTVTFQLNSTLDRTREELSELQTVAARTPQILQRLSTVENLLHAVSNTPGSALHVTELGASPRRSIINTRDPGEQEELDNLILGRSTQLTMGGDFSSSSSTGGNPSEQNLRCGRGPVGIPKPAPRLGMERGPAGYLALDKKITELMDFLTFLYAYHPDRPEGTEWRPVNLGSNLSAASTLTHSGGAPVIISANNAQVQQHLLESLNPSEVKKFFDDIDKNRAKRLFYFAEEYMTEEVKEALDDLIKVSQLPRSDTEWRWMTDTELKEFWNRISKPTSGGAIVSDPLNNLKAQIKALKWGQLWDFSQPFQVADLFLQLGKMFKNINSLNVSELDNLKIHFRDTLKAHVDKIPAQHPTKHLEGGCILKWAIEYSKEKAIEATTITGMVDRLKSIYTPVSYTHLTLPTIYSV